MFSGYEEIAIELVKSGAFVPDYFPEGVTPFALAEQQGMPQLADVLRLARSNEYPDWELFISGVVDGRRAHISRALEIQQQAEVRVALDRAMLRDPVATIRTARELRRFELLCPSGRTLKRAAGEISRDELARAIASARHTQLAIGIEKQTQDYDACLASLGPSGAVAASR